MSQRYWRGAQYCSASGPSWQGIEFATALPEHLLDASSALTWTELYGVAEIALSLDSVYRGRRHKVITDNLDRVFIMGGLVPLFATETRQWGEIISGRSPSLERQRFWVLILDPQIELEFCLTLVWVPRDLNVRADLLSHAAGGQQHHYAVRADLFAYRGCWRAAGTRTSRKEHGVHCAGGQMSVPAAPEARSCDTPTPLPRTGGRQW